MIGKNNTSIATLTNPATRQEHHFLSVPSGATSKKEASITLMEVQSVPNVNQSKNYGSFLVGSRVISNGNLHVATRIDPLFLALGYVDADSLQQWQPFDQWLDGLALPQALQQALSVEQWKHLCDTKGMYGDADGDDDDLVLYKFNPDKVLSWLEIKYQRALKVLQEQYVARSLQEQVIRAQNKENQGAFHSGFQPAPEEDLPSTTTLTPPPMTPTTTLSEDQMRLAREESLQLVCEYLSQEWRTKLTDKVGLSPDALLSERQRRRAKQEEKDDGGGMSNNKKRASWEAPAGHDESQELLQFTMGNNSAAGDDAEDIKAAKQKHDKIHAKTHGVKRLAKVSTKGMKSLSSFFGGAAKKSKK